jgi:hypothetical protein
LFGQLQPEALPITINGASVSFEINDISIKITLAPFIDVYWRIMQRFAGNGGRAASFNHPRVCYNYFHGGCVDPA